ncbi:hypothetical protein LOK49_LG07G01489 [Camellia lanceoleosa]|uniref:Uncharacterized protein n=1 Tax=Camellia lanceoleosa TaxID=1840588 RepID=A0ACC0H2B9_9ERIC|nr:hypothetical protein LOK49_LG07G01489 [Camellia lanceoleosa]
MPRILLKKRGAFENADTGGAWLSSARVLKLQDNENNQNLHEMKDGQILKNETTVVDDLEEICQSPVIAVDEAQEQSNESNISCIAVAMIAKSEKQVAGPEPDLFSDENKLLVESNLESRE